VFSEIAIYVDGVTVNFGALRQNLIIGCLAAIALLVSMLSIGLLFNRYIRARQLEQQLELARSVQTDLLPTADNKGSSKDFDFAAIFLPAATVGGDFYDIFTAEDGPVSMVLGDVAGKGISAALLMGVLHGAIRCMSWTKSAGDQEEASQWLNRFLCEKTARERFVSLFWAYFMPQTGLLRYVNAGHLPPLLLRANTKLVPQVEKLEAGGPVLGLLPLAEYVSSITHVEEGDVLVIFSDGVAEAANANDEEFGASRIAEIVRQHIALPPQLICDAVLNEVNEFLGELKPHDDLTLLVIRLAPAKKLNTEADIPSSASVAR
jgi:sigma-B regulation protein RsbU (phosphoserine phosphatase)